MTSFHVSGSPHRSSKRPFLRSIDSSHPRLNDGLSDPILFCLLSFSRTSADACFTVQTILVVNGEEFPSPRVSFHPCNLLFWIRRILLACGRTAQFPSESLRPGSAPSPL